MKDNSFTHIEKGMDIDMLEKLKKVICEYVEIEENAITEESRFIEDLGFNSYDFMSMIGEIEDEFDVEVEEREVIKVRTVGDAIRYVEELKQPQGEGKR